MNRLKKDIKKSSKTDSNASLFFMQSLNFGLLNID